MRFRSKIFAVLTVVGLLPLLVLGFLSFTVNRDELERTATQSQESLAQEAARGAEHWVARGVEGLRLSISILPFEQLQAGEVAAALHIPYGQLQFIDALALLDERGNLAAPLVAEARPGSSHPAFTAADLPHFLAAVPLELALQAGTALGAPYLSASGEPHVAVAVRISSRPQRAVAAQFSLDELRAAMQEIARPPAVAFLTTTEGGLLASASPRPSPEPFAALISAASGVHAASPRALPGPGGEAWIASAAPVGGLGWAAGPALRVRRYTVFWAAVALLLTAALGLMVSRSLTVPIDRLKKSAQDLQQGRYHEPIGAFGQDELGELAQAFGHMAREIQRRDEEIRAWNAELQRRVDQRGEER